MKSGVGIVLILLGIVAGIAAVRGTYKPAILALGGGAKR